MIAEHMARAHREVPPVTWVEECDFESVDVDRLVAAVVKACADELQAFPELNARLELDAIVYLERYDIGVAVQTPQGLIVPVVRGCDAKSVDEIHDELAALAKRGRAGELHRGAPWLDVHRHERRQARRAALDADRQPPGGRDLSIGRIGDRPVVRRRDRRPAHGDDLRDVRSSRDRRRSRSRVRSGRHRAARRQGLA